MKKYKNILIKKILITCILVSIFLLYVSPFTQSFYADSEILNLDIPKNISWKDESTSTATWDIVENANYYFINVYIYDNEEKLIESKETGTTSNEIDLQQEIVYLANHNSLKTFNISFDVTAAYITDLNTIYSNTSNESNKLKYDIGNGTTRLETPTNINIDENYNATWNASKNADFYVLSFKINGGKYYENECVFLSKSNDFSYGYESNGIFKGNLEKAIINMYNSLLSRNRIENGESIEIEISVKAEPELYSDKYISSYSSEYSNSFIYSNNTIIKLDTPTNIFVDNEYNATWTASNNADYYALIFLANGKYVDSECVFLNKSTNFSYGTVSNGIFKGNIEKAISNVYNYLGSYGKINPGESVELKFYVVARANSYSDKYIDSDASEYSNSFIYSNNSIIKLDTPTNIYVDEEYNATWTAPSNVNSFRLMFKVNGRNYTIGESVFLEKSTNFSYGTVSNGVFKGNIEKAVVNAYNRLVSLGRIESGDTVEIEVCVSAKPELYSNKYLGSDASEYSNKFYYNCDGSTKIDRIVLSPNQPVIAVGRSIYIGKTIEPNNALYSNINWSSSDNSIVSVDNMGQITGINKGAAIITAKINNAIQKAEVNVYEIKSNINNYQQANQVINETNEIIENIISGEEVSNTDLVNNQLAIDEIEEGAKNGDLFKVDLNYDSKENYDYDNDIKNEISNSFEGFDVACGNDVTVEVSHIDENGIQHHITNIKELKNDIDIIFPISSSVPKLETNKYREYKLVRNHENQLEEINFDVENGIVKTSSNKFSDYILLYRDVDMPSYKVSGNVISSNFGTNDVHIKLISSNSYETIYDSRVRGTSSNYEILNVPSGNYTIIFEKEQHTRTELNIEINNADLIINTTLQLIGDINKDGKIDDEDIKTLNEYFSGNIDTIDKTVSDLNKDDFVNETDKALLRDIIINMPIYNKGDLDRNSVVDANDASIALEIFKAENATTEDIAIGDMDGNNLIDANDASLILELYKTNN